MSKPPKEVWVNWYPQHDDGYAYPTEREARKHRMTSEHPVTIRYTLSPPPTRAKRKGKKS